MIKNNLYVQKQTKLLTSAVKNVQNSWTKANYRYINVANDQTHAFLQNGISNPSITKIIEHDIITKKGNILEQGIWSRLKDTCFVAKNELNERFKKMYKTTYGIREKLIANNRINIDKVTPRMTKFQKFIFKYLK